MKFITLNKFDGMVNDPRTPSASLCRYSGNYDIFTDNYRMTPYRASEDGSSDQANVKIQNFCVALGASSTYKIFGLGVVTGTGRAEIFTKELTTGAATDLDDSGWNETANNAAASGTTSFNLFVYYKYTTVGNSRIFGASGGNRIWSYDPTGSAAFDNAGRNINYSNIAQGLVHSKDDILYIPYDNKIAKNDQGSWTDVALTLPEHLYITSICEFGNYIAIACAPLFVGGHSRVYLWDRDTSLATLSDTIDWGEETLKIIEEVDGVLVGISLSGANATRFADRVIFRQLYTSEAVKFAEFIGGTSTTLPIAKQKINNRINFLLSLSVNGTVREGVWSVGRPSLNSPFSVVHERSPNNDTALTGGVLLGFISVGDFMFISYVDNSVYTMSKTKDSADFNYLTGIRETLINPGIPPEDKFIKKKLFGVLVNYEAIPTNGQVELEYRVDGGSWTDVFTDTTVGSRFSEMTKAGSTAFTDGREYEFRVLSKGTSITGLTYRYDTLSSPIKS